MEILTSLDLFIPCSDHT